MRDNQKPGQQMSFPVATKHTKPNPKRKHGVLIYWTLSGHPGEWHYVEQLPHNRINDPQISNSILQHKVASISTAQGIRYALFTSHVQPPAGPA